MKLPRLSSLSHPCGAECARRGFLPFFFLTLLVILPGALHAQWEPDLKLSTTDSSARTNENMARCLLSCGDTLHAVWFDVQNNGSAIYYKRSSDRGTTWGADTRISGIPGTADYPSLAQSGSTLHLVFRDRRSGKYASYYKRSLDGGRTWGPDVFLDTTCFWPSVAAVGPMVFAALNDTVVTGNSEVFFRRSTDNGTGWELKQRISSAPGRSEDPCITAAGSYVHLVWNEFRDGNCEVYTRRSSDQGVTWGPETRLTNAPNHSYSPDVVVSDSIVDVAWEDRRTGDYDIYRIRSTDFGLTWGTEQRLTSDTANSAYPSFVLSGSNIHLVWFNFGGGIFYLRSTDHGASWDPAVHLVSGASSPGMPFIAFSGPVLHLIWQDQRDGHGAIYYKRNLTGNSGVEGAPPVPSGLSLYGAFPNPFTSFAAVPGHGREAFSLYDVSGRKVGTYRGDRVGEGLPPGVYFLRSADGSSGPLRIVKVR
jgi:hypothetical protein